MKGKSLLFGLCLCLWTSLGWGQRVIEVPWYETTNTYMFDIIKMELTDEATVITGQVKYFPNEWFRVVGRTVLRGESGKEYKLLKAEGIKLNEQVFLPESGQMTFQLYFEPVDAGEKKVDYVEGNHETDWWIGGIVLDEKPQKLEKESDCLIRGKVLGHPSSYRLVLMGYYDDYRIQKPYAIIPVRNGKFEYLCKLGESKMYWLVFTDELVKSSYRPVSFFIEPGEVEITIQSEDAYTDSETRGKEVNELYQRYQQLREEQFHFSTIYRQYDSLSEPALYYTPRALELHELMSQNYENKQKYDSLDAIYQQLKKENKECTPQAIVLNEKYKNLRKEEQKWKEGYMEKYPSVATYFLLMDDLRHWVDYRVHGFPEELEILSFKDLPRLENMYYTIYKPMFPKHSYTELIATMLQSLKQIEVGGHYIDFAAPDFEGNPVTLSGQIKGKVALIDLWASWCGSCRRSAKSMIPVYEKYKSKGFTIVGVAREKTVQTAKAAALQDGYPWLNLVELNDAGNIWFKYCVGNSGGGTFLVDRDGKILAIGPSPEEVERILEKMLE
ncbi:MAG: AhpC/TSA family protein [Bacteroidales bacterium]|nr:AhpC/TSA family protein [Bacteroidales bacterium]